MTVVRHHTAVDGLDRFIPVRKSDILSALVEQDAFADDGEREKFCRLCEMLAAIYHYDCFKMLERLRDDYYYFSPEVARHAAVDGLLVERSYADLVQTLDAVLKEANFVEVPHAEVGDAHRRRTVLRVEVEAPLDDFREVRFYRRGRHDEQFEVVEWFGLRRRTIQAEVYDDVVMMIAAKSAAEVETRKLRRLQRRKIIPGSVLLKYFHNVASSDLNALFPNVRVVMSRFDKLMLGVPALAGGIPILLNLYATTAVLILVIGFYLGLGGTVADKDMKTALAALGGLVALGGFAMQQWVRYQRQSLKYQVELTENVYFRNINNNMGIFDYLIGAAEDQEGKEVFLAYHFLHVATSPPTADELDSRIEAWLLKTFGINLDFEVDGALDKLQRLGLLERKGERLFVSPLDGALAQLDRTWRGLFPREAQAAAQ